jgi:hypothetical protein
MRIHIVRVASVLLLLGSCRNETQKSLPNAAYRGVLRIDPEDISFQRCETSATDAWLWAIHPDLDGPKSTGEWNTALAILQSQQSCDIGDSHCKSREVYLEMNGTVSGVGNHNGHMRRITATQIIYAARTPRGDCRLPKDSPPVPTRSLHNGEQRIDSGLER